MAGTRRRALLVAAAGALLLAACGGNGSANPPASTSSLPATGDPCGATAAASATVTPTIGGHQRTVIVHVPTGYTAKSAVPLVLNMHGSGSTASQQELFTGMDATPTRTGSSWRTRRH